MLVPNKVGGHYQTTSDPSKRPFERRFSSESLGPAKIGQNDGGIRVPEGPTSSSVRTHLSDALQKTLRIFRGYKVTDLESGPLGRIECPSDPSSKKDP